MRGRIGVVLAAGLLAPVAVPVEAPAQIADRMRVEQERARRDDSRVYDRSWDDWRWERDDRGRTGRARAQGPAFCRSGAGHPVFGREWCRQKGFGLGGRDIYWERVRWSGVVFRVPRDRRNGWYGTRDLGGRELAFLLGDGVLRRFTSHSRELGYRGSLTGGWYGGRDGLRLRLFAGGFPLADLVDRNGDGRVDVIELARLR
jgi:hypothetical protein